MKKTLNTLGVDVWKVVNIITINRSKENNLIKFIKEVIMRRIFFILFIVLMSFGYSENLDKYESKRVFDKTIDLLLTGNLEKYKNDREMTRALKGYNKENPYLKKIMEGIERNKYEIIGVQEENDKSILTVKAIYYSYAAIPREELLQTFLIVNDDINELEKTTEGNVSGEELIIEISSRFYEKYKDRMKIETKIVKVNMDKKNGFWHDTENNDEFYDTMLPIYKYLVDFVNEYSE